MSTRARIVCEDGRIFTGESFGARGSITGHLIVETSATAYEQSLVDRTNDGAIALLATPHVGNTGMNLERTGLRVAGIIARDPVPRSSSIHAHTELEAQMVKDGVVGIRDVDTRALIRHARGQKLTVTIESEL